MDLIKNGNLAATTEIHKDEEMPYEGKSVASDKNVDGNGMKLEGSSK